MLFLFTGYRSWVRVYDRRVCTCVDVVGARLRVRVRVHVRLCVLVQERMRMHAPYMCNYVHVCVRV